MTVARSAEGQAFRLEPWDCPTCGPGEKRFIGFRGGPYHRYGLGVATRIVRCESCSLMFPDPFPVPEQVLALYGDPERYFATHDPARHLEGHRTLVRDILCRTGKKQPVILDVGSGRGEVLRAAFDAGLGETVGLELSPAMVSYAQENHDVTVLAETVEEHAARVRTRRYDAVVLAAVLEHVQNPDSTIAAIAKVTQPGGILYLDLPHEPNLMTILGNASSRLRRVRTVFNLSPTFTPFHVYGFSLHALETVLNKHGFEIEERVVWATPSIPSTGGLGDRLRSLVATQINRIANHTGTASNQFVWARASRLPAE